MSNMISRVSVSHFIITRLEIPDVTKLNHIPCFNQRCKFSSDQQISSFFLLKIFENKMCQIWSKQVENGGIGTLYIEFPVFSSASTFISVQSTDIHLIFYYPSNLFFLLDLTSELRPEGSCCDHLASIVCP